MFFEAILPDLAHRPILAEVRIQQVEVNRLRRLNEGEIAEGLRQLPQWKIDDQKIVYTHEFKNFMEAVSFVNCLIEPAETAGHHPDLTISYNRVTISLTTHDAGGLTVQDFELAKTISQILSNWRPGNVCLVLQGN